jgi:hypothetical protein
MRRQLALVLLVCAGGITATGLSSVGGSSCSAAAKAQRTQVAAAFAGQMPAARAAYFKAHPRAADRKAFVKRQQAKLALLRGAAACVVPPPSTTTAEPTAPPVATQQTFVFDAGITAASQTEIRDDVDFALRDEARLLGAELTAVSVFTSNSPAWLADEECRFFGHDNDACRQSAGQRWASGGTTALGGTGGVFLYWAHPSWQAGPGETQKIIAHELFHVFERQLDKLGSQDEVTPSSQVRASGPVWLDEGAAEMIGYHVSSDRGLTSYPVVLAGQITRARQVGQPLGATQTYDQFTSPYAYSFGHVAADHLVGLAPGGVAALATYYNAVGSGVAWPAAFQTAFGIGVDAYDANFDAYLSKS